jgi:hypothetical protein
MSHRFRILWAVAALWAWSTEPVAAYIDPGTGTALVQTLLAGIVAMTLALRRRVHAIWRRFRPGKSDLG